MKSAITLHSVRLIVLGLLVSAATAHGQWVSTSGFYGDMIYSLTESGTTLLAGTDAAGVFGSINGSSWNAMNTGLTDTMTVWSLAAKDRNVFAGTKQHGVYSSTNSGASWRAASTGLPSGCTVVALMLNGNTLYAGLEGGGVYRTTNSGTSWTNISTGLPDYVTIWSFAVIGSHLFAGGEDGYLYVTTNNGANWSLTCSTPFFGVLQSLAVVGQTIVAGTWGDGVHVSNDLGATWQTAGSNLPTVFINTLLVYGNSIIAGTDGGGVVASNDLGANWYDVSDGLDNLFIGSLLVSGQYAYAGTLGEGVWRRPLNEVVTGIEESAPVSHSISLFPNPASTHCTVRFESQHFGPVHVSIRNLLGESVYERVCESVGSSVSIPTANITPGLYMMVVRAGRENHTMRLMVR